MKKFTLLFLFLLAFTFADFSELATVYKWGDLVLIRTPSNTWALPNTYHFNDIESGERIRLTYRTVYYDNQTVGLTKWIKFIRNGKVRKIITGQ